MNNPVWMMSSAYPGKTLDQLIETAGRIGLQGLELCVFRRDGSRQDHVATHLDYEDFDSDAAAGIIRKFNDAGLHLMIGAYENLIGGDPDQRRKNQDHLLHLIRIAALMGGDANGVMVGTFVGYNHQWDCEEGSFERNLEEYRRVFTPIIGYAEDLGVSVVYENCPMEGWRSADYSSTMNNLPSTLAARKLMYALIPGKAHGEIYDPSHDIWQFVDPTDVLEHSDMDRIRLVHLKTTRMVRDAGSIYWGNVFGKQTVSRELAEKAGVPVARNEWDRFSYEPMVPGFGGSDSMDWRRFADDLMARGYNGPFSIENEGANSKGTDNQAAIEQGFEACLGFMKPMIWNLGENGYAFQGQRTLDTPQKKSIPLKHMSDFSV